MRPSKDDGLICEHEFFPVGNCATEIWGIYGSPVDSLTCLNKYIFPVYVTSFLSIPCLSNLNNIYWSKTSQTRTVVRPYPTSNGEWT